MTSTARIIEKRASYLGMSFQNLYWGNKESGAFCRCGVGQAAIRVRR